MSQTSTLKDAFRASALVTALNVNLTAASLPTVTTADGIYRHRSYLPLASQIPAVACEVSRTQRGGPEGSQGGHFVTAEVSYYLLVSADTPPDVLDAAETYPDCLRAAVETAVRPSLPLLFWQSTEVEGELVETERGDLARLQRVTFRVQSWQAEGVV